MELEKTRVLRGPNIWARCTALEIAVNLGDQDRPAREIPGFLPRLNERFPNLITPNIEEDGELNLAQLLARIVVSLQSQAGSPVSFSHVASDGKPGSYKVVCEYREEEVGREALEIGRQLIEAALAGNPFELPMALRRLRVLDEQIRLGPTTGSIVQAARERGIPVRRLNGGSLVQLGWGARQRHILAAETDRTSAIAESIAQDKELTKELLRSVGVPVPAGRPVRDAEDAWSAACELGPPVVVKPMDGNQGRGVAVNLMTREQVMAAYAAAREESDSIIVERFALGCDHRLLVIGNRLVAAALRRPPQVVGDGVHTIAQLVEKQNADPRRGEDHATSLSKMKLDAIGMAVLAEQRYTPASVPPAGAVVLLRRNANLSTGGSAADVTDQVHPEVAARAVDAARVVGLDVAGIDVVCCDIGRPLEEQGGVIVEVNAAPGFRMHLTPSSGKPRPAGQAVVSTMFADGDNGRVPLVAVTGNNGKTTTVRLIAHILKTRGKCVGMTCTDGIYIDERRIDLGDCSGPKSARAVLSNPQVEAAVLETARGGILREGLGFDQCDVAVVTNIGEGDHLGMNGITTTEQLAAVKRTIVANVAPTGAAVLNAHDPYAAEMASHCPGSVIFFAREASHPIIAAHRGRGGRVVYVSGETIVAAQGAQEHPVASLSEVAITQRGRIPFQVENSLAAVAAAWAVGTSWEVIRAGLSSFVNDTRHAPARFNLIEHRGATIIIDYGHNPDALRALVDAIDHLPHQRRSIVISAAGDRRDVDILAQAKIVGDSFDEVILFEDQCNRGRPDGEVMGLLRKGLIDARRTSQITELHGEFLAIETGLRKLRAGDLILLLVDQVEPSLAFIEQLLSKPASLPASPRLERGTASIAPQERKRRVQDLRQKMLVGG
jgi:cyanophycin synthetase